MTSARAADKAESPATFYRCPVQAEHSRGVIKIGRRAIQATVQEASIEGFTVLVEPKYSKRLSVGIPWILEYNGARLEIQAQWFFHAPDGHIQVGLRRLRDLTELNQSGSWWPWGGGGRAVEDAGQSTIAFAGFVLVVFVTMALPGIGDQLGTAAHINELFRSVVDGINNQFARIW